MRTCTIEGCDKPHRARGYCAGHYNKILAADRHLTIIKCDECGKTYTTTRTNGRYCSLECRDAERHRESATRRAVLKAERAALRSALLSTRICVACGNQYAPRSTQQRYCTGTCRDKALHIARIHDQGGLTTEEWTALDRTCDYCGQVFHLPSPQARHCNSTCRRKDGDRRGALHARGSKWIGPTRRARLYARDDYTCWLCGDPIDMDADPRRSDWGPSLDHVTPRSQGGDDSDDNLRTAHRWCNAVRSDNDPFGMFAASA